MFVNSHSVSIKESVKDQKLRRKFWKFEPEINPEYVRYHRINGDISGNSMSFKLNNITPNSLLLSKAYIKWSFTVNKVKNQVPQVAENFVNDEQIIAKSNIFENCLKNIKMSINGRNIGSYQEPRYWAKYLTRSFQNDNLLFSTDGGHDLNYNGSYNQAGIPSARVPAFPNTPLIDDEKFRESNDTIFTEVTAAFGTDTATFSFLSLLNFGLFDKYYGDTKRSYLGWHENMSSAIPYVKDLDINIQMNRIETNALNYVFGLTTAGGFESVELVNGRISSAQLVLQWVDSPSKNIEEHRDYFGESVNLGSIQNEVFLQSYSVKFNKFNLGVINDGTLFEMSPTPRREMPLYSVPDYFLIFATVDKDSDSYKNISNVFASDLVSTNLASSINSNANESNMNFEELKINVNINTQIVNSEWNQKELYNLTMSNSKKGYSFTKFSGGQKLQGNYPSNAYILVKPSDIGIKKSSGESTNRLSLQFEAKLRATDGNVGLQDAVGGNREYVFCIALIYDNYFVYMNKDGLVNPEYSGQFI